MRYLCLLLLLLGCGGGDVKAQSAVDYKPDTVVQKFHDTHTDLARQWTRIYGLTIDLEVTIDSHLFLYGHINLEHRNLVDGPVGFGLCMSLKRADTHDGLGPYPTDSVGSPIGYQILGSKTGGNIRDIEDHYGYPSLDGYASLEPGWYRVEVWGASHSSLAPDTDGLIHVLIGDGDYESGRYNQLVARITPR